MGEGANESDADKPMPRDVEVGVGDDETWTDTRILDAAIEVMGIHGEQKLTMDLVADRAGMSRMTVFRKFKSKQNLIDTVYRREVRSVLGEVEQQGRTARSAAECATIVMTHLVERAGRHPVVQWLVRARPGTVVEMWGGGTFHGQTSGRELVSNLLQGKSLTDPMSQEDADLVADVIIRLVMSLILVPHVAERDHGIQATREYIRRTMEQLF